MTTVLLRIFFHGMIAFVPMTGGGNQMKALLVDSQTPPDVASRCVAEHRPELRFRTSNSECIAAASIGCQVDGADCSCSLVRQEISFATTVTPAQVKFNVQPPRKMPDSPTSEAAELSYIPNILNIHNAKLNQDFLNLKPKLLLDRMTFSYDTVEPCMLAARNLAAGGSEVHTFSFGRLGDTTGSFMGQAIAQMMTAQATVPYDGITTMVGLNVLGFDHPTSFSMNLLTQPCDPHGSPTPVCIDVTLGNAREELPTPSECDDGVGRDFAFFYELLNNPPPWESRLLPIDDNTVKVDSTLLEIKECADHPKGPMNRPICAMASFIP